MYSVATHTTPTDHHPHHLFSTPTSAGDSMIDGQPSTNPVPLTLEDDDDDDGRGGMKNRRCSVLAARWSFLLALVVVCTVSGILAGTLIGVNDDDNISDNNRDGHVHVGLPTLAPTFSDRARTIESILGLLEDDGTSSSSSSSSSSKQLSPTQAQVIQWLAYNDTQLDDDDNSIIKNRDITVDPATYKRLRWEQRYALGMLHATTGQWISKFGGWATLSGSRQHECNWAGVICNSQDLVIEVLLDDDIASLVGTLPSELSRLSQLERLLLKDHPGLTGSLPTQLYTLPELYALQIANCTLNSTIDANIANLSKLIMLDLSTNSLQGNVPASIWTKLANLQFLYLDDNPELEGTPFLDVLDDNNNNNNDNNGGDSILLPSLQYLWVERTRMTLPEAVCQIPTLVDVRTDCDQTCSCCATRDDCRPN